MSIRLRVRYSVRSFVGFFYGLSVPEYLTGTATKSIICLTLVVLTIGYVFQISLLTTGGYEIANLEKKLAVLSDESQKLNSEAASYQSLSSVQERIKNLKMVPAAEITYIKAPIEQAVAQR